MSSGNPNEILTETSDDGGGVETGYKCAYHVSSGTISDSTAIVKDTYYDMKYPCDLDPQAGAVETGAVVLRNIATEFRILPDGDACTIPDTTLPLWMIGVSSEPSDSVLKTLECQELSTEGESDMCCVVIHAPMTFWWTDGDFTEGDILGVLSSHFNSPVPNVESSDYEIRYLGAFVEQSVGTTDGTQLPPPTVNNVGKNNTTKTNQGRNVQPNRFTLIGGFVLGGLVAVFVAAVFVLVRRRHKSRREHVVEVEIHKSEYDEDGSDGPTLEVDVMSDDMHQHQNHHGGGHHYPNGPAMRNSFDFQQDDVPTPSSYTFDLAWSLKNDVMGAHGGSGSDFGPTSMAVVPPYPMEETSDSEADSWAQTDGTVGSLEDRLEEITAEI